MQIERMAVGGKGRPYAAALLYSTPSCAINWAVTTLGGWLEHMLASTGIKGLGEGRHLSA
ncbi:hypothetical protein ABT294_40160 [Nonomuraea sp. NPDC000554]|uniref:hypothetical protein n=1 Tax=Nonomuraea sp. NPDC000554 TaxID=3154259 RepID=UPI00331CE040